MYVFLGINSKAISMHTKPREIRWSLYCLFALIALNLLSLFIILAENASISAALIAGMKNTLPSLSVDNVKGLVSHILFRRNVFHVFVIVCWSILTYAVYKGWNWGRIILIIFTLLSFIGSIYAFSTGQNLILQVIAVLGWIGRIVLLWLLLVPPASRYYFMARAQRGEVLS